MIQLILEYPWVVLGIGIALTIAAIQVGLQVGNKSFFLLAGFTLLLAGILCYAGHSIETERESVKSMLKATAEAIEKGDLQTVYDSIYPNPSISVIESRDNLERFRLDRFHITKFFGFEFSGPENARRAKVALNIFVEGRFRQISLRHPRYLEVVLYRLKDRWLVYDYMESDPMQGFKDRLNPDGAW